MSEEIVTNEYGGQGSKLDGRFDLVPPSAWIALAQVLEHGARKYSPNNWRRCPIHEHLGHAMSHIATFQRLVERNRSLSLRGRGVAAGPEALEEELSHAACRVMMALEIFLVGMDPPVPVVTDEPAEVEED